MNVPEPIRQPAKESAATPVIRCYVYAGGYRWHWRQTLDSFPGQPVVLVHGLVVQSAQLIPLAAAISDWAPVLIPDLPGFGLSTGNSRRLAAAELAIALAEWMRVVGVAPAHVVATSFGCQVAAELATYYPQRLRSLSMVGPIVDPAARNFKSQAARIISDIPKEPIGLWTEDPASGFRVGRRLLMGTVQTMLQNRIENKLSRITAPALVIRGAEDPIAPESWTRQAAQLLPHAGHLSLAAGAHYVCFSHPLLVAAAVRKFTFPLRNLTR